MYCVKCGQQVPDSDRFCTRCGAPMEPAPAPQVARSAPQAAPAPAPAPLPQAPTATAPQPAPAAAPQTAPAWPATVQALRYAGFWQRFIAALIDGVLIGLLWFVMSGLYDFATTRILENTAFAPDGIALGRALWLISGGRWLMTVLVALLYFALPEATRRGASPGKLVMRLRVARTDGDRAGIGRSVLRTALKPLSAAPLMLGFLMAAWSRRKQALHDLLSGSVVLRA